MTTKRIQQHADSYVKAVRFRDTYGYGPDSEYVHAEPAACRDAATVQAWFEMDVEDFERARLFLDRLAADCATAADEGLVIRTGIR